MIIEPYEPPFLYTPHVYVSQSEPEPTGVVRERFSLDTDLVRTALIAVMLSFLLLILRRRR